MSGGWIGVALDGTLAKYDYWRGIDHIGESIPAMIARVKQWIAEGHEVKIFTARITQPGEKGICREAILPIKVWCLKQIGKSLPITNVKDYACRVIYDDRAVQVETNTGRLISESEIVSENKGYPTALDEEFEAASKMAKVGELVCFVFRWDGNYTELVNFFMTCLKSPMPMHTWDNRTDTVKIQQSGRKPITLQKGEYLVHDPNQREWFEAHTEKSLSRQFRTVSKRIFLRRWIQAPAPAPSEE